MGNPTVSTVALIGQVVITGSGITKDYNKQCKECILCCVTIHIGTKILLEIGIYAYTIVVNQFFAVT